MTNLDIIKYLTNNNPAHIAKFLDDIYNDAYLEGYNDDWDAKPNFEKWLFEDVSDSGLMYFNDELEEWTKALSAK